MTETMTRNRAKIRMHDVTKNVARCRNLQEHSHMYTHTHKMYMYMSVHMYTECFLKVSAKACRHILLMKIMEKDHINISPQMF